MKARSHSKYKYAKGIDYNPNGCHLKSQACKEIKVHNGVKKHKNSICKQIFPFIFFQDRVDITLEIVKGTLQVRIIHPVTQIT